MSADPITITIDTPSAYGIALTMFDDPSAYTRFIAAVTASTGHGPYNGAIPILERPTIRWSA